MDSGEQPDPSPRVKWLTTLLRAYPRTSVCVFLVAVYGWILGEWVYENGRLPHGPLQWLLFAFLPVLGMLEDGLFEFVIEGIVKAFSLLGRMITR